MAIRQNRGGFFNFGQQMPDIREGDTLQPGMPVADVLDLSELEVLGQGRRTGSRQPEGRPGRARCSWTPFPDKQFHGKIKAMSGTATPTCSPAIPSKKFDVIFAIDMRQLLTGAGHEAGGRRPHHGDGGGERQEELATGARRIVRHDRAAARPAAAPGTPGGAPGMPGGPARQGAPGVRAARQAAQRPRPAARGRWRPGRRGGRGGRGGGEGCAAAGGQGGAAVRATCPTKTARR